ncbi:MAG: von Willebrand factor type A domain-containing protein [Clostridia bacterium]|nr:von Willebrand factor type A domain-containing protein [Clostridia bacterium]
MKKKFFAGITAVVLSAVLLAGCSAANMGDSAHRPGVPDWEGSHGDMYDPAGTPNGGTGDASPDNPSFIPGPGIDESGTQSAEQTSYLSLDRNTAGYTLMRSQVYANKFVSSTVRVEELYNYFDYDYPAPEAGEGVKATAYLSDCPWNAENKLLTIGLKTEQRVLEKTRNNYVFLVDVSGSMRMYINTESGRTQCLDLVKYGIKTLVEGLSSRDSVSIVTYASKIQTVLEPTFASEAGKQEIINAVDGLAASGATNGSGGLELAYENAEKYYSEDGNNRVILLSDGDFNTGITDTNKLKALISEKAKSGVYLSVMGVGMSSKQDPLMETLARNGNGNYAFIDTEREARKAFCEELNGTLITVLKDAKASVTFNPEQVASYRMVGYDTKTISKDDFENPGKDTGEVGSDLCVSTVYEVTLAPAAEDNAEIAEVLVRFKDPKTDESKEVRTKAYNTNTDSKDIAFIACVAEFGLVIRNSQYKGTASVRNVINRLWTMGAYLETDEYKQEFLEIAKKAQDQGYYGN